MECILHLFDLVTKCFYDTTKYPEYGILKLYRKITFSKIKTRLKLPILVQVQSFKSNVREISKIAQTAGITQKNAELLFRIVRYFQPKHFRNWNFVGISDSALSLGNEKAKSSL